MGYAFISYSTKNQTEADAMNALLKRHGVNTWMAPGDIPPGSTYARAINIAIRESACLVFLLSKESQDSVWVAKEIERAINYRKTVFPVQLDDVVLNDEFELYISSNQLIRMTQVSDTHPEFARLLSCVKALTGESGVVACSTEDTAASRDVAQPQTSEKVFTNNVANDGCVEFEDISYSLYDKDGLHIEFCNFEVDHDDVTISFWVENNSSSDVRLWMMDGKVNGETELSLYLEELCTVQVDDHDFGKLSVKNVSPNGRYTISACIEIDDVENHEQDRTPTFSILVDFDNGTQTVKLQGETEDQAESEEVEFKDISFALYDKEGLHVEFCNFEVDGDDVSMSFWVKNYWSRDVKLFAVRICVDGEANSTLEFEYIGTVKTNDAEFCTLTLHKVLPDGSHTVNGYIEIDDLENNELDRTPTFTVNVDFDDGTQIASLDEPKQETAEDTEAIEFEDIEFHAYNKNGIDVQFCNFEIEDGIAYFNFWVHNASEKAINVYAQDIYVDGKYVSAYEKIGFYKPKEYGYGRFALSEVTPDTYYTIKTYAEIDNEDSSQCIDEGDPFCIHVDFEDGTLSAKKE